MSKNKMKHKSNNSHTFLSDIVLGLNLLKLITHNQDMNCYFFKEIISPDL